MSTSGLAHTKSTKKSFFDPLPSTILLGCKKEWQLIFEIRSFQEQARENKFSCDEGHSHMQT